MSILPNLSLNGRLTELATHPRAVPWKIRYRSGLSGSSPERSFVLFAPSTAEAARLVLMRLHNGVLLLNPAGVELDAPVEAARLEPTLSEIRGIHRVSIVLAGEPWLPASTYDLPSVDVPPPVEVSGPAVGLDIGGTTIKGCVLAGGVIVGTASTPTWPDGERGIGSLIRRCRAMVEELAGKAAERSGERPGSLGIGLASPMGVGGHVLELSTVMRERVGEVGAFAGFSERVAEGLVDGPVAMFNDLSNLGRHLSAQGARRMARVQIGTSFGGCWVDADGMVSSTEMGRLVVYVGPEAVPHTYLPLRGAMRMYLSNTGLAASLAAAGERVDPRTSGHHLKALLELGHPAGRRAVEQMAEAMRGVVEELHALLPGLRRVECGGSMLAGPAGRMLQDAVYGRGLEGEGRAEGRGEGRAELGMLSTVEFAVAAQPAHDGAIAAALAPRVEARLKGLRRVEA